MRNDFMHGGNYGICYKSQVSDSDKTNVLPVINPNIPLNEIFLDIYSVRQQHAVSCQLPNVAICQMLLALKLLLVSLIISD